MISIRNTAVLLTAFLTFAAPVRAENEGLAELDKATELLDAPSADRELGVDPGERTRSRFRRTPKGRRGASPGLPQGEEGDGDVVAGDTPRVSIAIPLVD